MVGYAFEVMRPLEHGDVLGEVFLMDTSERPQEVAQPRPDAATLLYADDSSV